MTVISNVSPTAGVLVCWCAFWLKPRMQCFNQKNAVLRKGLLQQPEHIRTLPSVLRCCGSLGVLYIKITGAVEELSVLYIKITGTVGELSVL